jgi:membrane protease YdiL (CAAX protease family)
MADNAAFVSGSLAPATARSRSRDFVELAVAYGLILLVVWTPRPWQKLLWWVAAAAIAAITCASFEGLKAAGLRSTNFLPSLWVVGAALLVSAIAVTVAAEFHSLRLPPGGPLGFIRNYCAYALWAFVQQFLLLAFFLSRLRRLFKSAGYAVAVTAIIFAAAHLPSPILTPITLIWGLAACLLFLRYRNLYTLAMAHALLGITIAIAIPGPVDHNMRVGLGYLTYAHAHRAAPSAQP